MLIFMSTEQNPSDERFKVYPEFSDRNHFRPILSWERVVGKEDYQLFKIGDGFLGSAEYIDKSSSQGTRYAIKLVAYTAAGWPVFTGAVDFINGEVWLGQMLGPFFTHSGYRGRQIASKMAVVGLFCMQKLIKDRNLPTRKIALRSSSAVITGGGKLVGLLGMERIDGVQYEAHSFTNLEALMTNLDISAY